MSCSTVSGTKYDLAQLQQLLRQTGWPESLIAKYAAVFMYESGGYVGAHNTCGENSYGLAQIYTRYHPDFDISRYDDPIYNLSYALGIYNVEHDHAWITSVGKYNRDYQGIASQSQAIYSNGNNDNPNQSYFSPYVLNQDAAKSQPDYVLYAALAALAFLVLKN